ncbi:serine/threonine-protein kinase mos-like [Mercenaria mercenaria]|uniref:serine/threonine-protein kinase mos-like n=1 Tax=Mercenaria mercenaria TaxID=6596 RepID=UPI001E1D56B6|nr:serine/threonine-protein kinase mos-like [Mercenaria mercenaria]
MLERQHSIGQTSPKHTPNRNHINRHSCLQRQKSRRLFQKQRTSVCLFSSKPADDTLNNNGEKVVSAKLRRMLLKHTKFGFIESFQNLTVKQVCDTDCRVKGESDQLVQNYPMPDNLVFDSQISAKIINKEEFELGRVLGAGGFGSVYLGSFKRQTVAIKVMHKYTKNPAAQLESFRAELHVMRFNHPNIVKTLAATHIDQFDDGAWVVMEYIGKSSLQGIINDHSEPFDSDRRLKYSIQVASALAYAHKNKVAHLDLKPANILITSTDDCKVGDFGCSQRVEFDTGIVSPTNRSILTGTFAYRAPELLRGEPPTFKADVYSYGITMWQMKSRETPFTNQNQHVVIFGVVANGLRPKDPEPSETDPFELSYKDLYSQCWNACPLDRPSAQELVELLNIWKENL